MWDTPRLWLLPWMSVSYEGFYGSILPIVLRIAGVLAVRLCAVHIGVRMSSHMSRATATAVGGHKGGGSPEGECQDGLL